MTFTHHGLHDKLSDDWWIEAGMVGFVPSSKAYRVKLCDSETRRVLEVRLDEVGPVRRNPGVSLFNDNGEGCSARERVVKILCGFRLSEPIPPVEVVLGGTEYGHRFKLVHGVHRFYCSLVAGYSHVPAVEGFDWATLDK